MTYSDHVRLPLLHPRGVLLVSAACFAALALAALLGGVLPADVAVRDAMLAVATPPVLAVMRVINFGGDKLVLAPATLLLFVAFPRARRRWWLWVALMIVAPVLEGLLKQIVARPRPETLSFGFPSGHATAAAAFFGAVVYLAGSLPRRAACLTVRTVALAVVLLVAVARIMLRAHWPSDTLGGIALGLGLAALAALLDARPPNDPRPAK